jgi:lysophospholipase L1-like esterase
MRSRGERKSRKPVFLLLAIGFSAVVFFSLDLFVGSLWDWTPQKSFRTSHAAYHHGLRPNRHQRTNWGQRSYSMITNSLGFRDRAPRAVPLETAHKRVVVIGDSMIEGLGVEFERTCVGLLQSQWADRQVEVQNAGVVSYSPRLYHLRIRHLLEREGFEFDHLIVFIDISDIQDELFYRDFVPATGEPEPAPPSGWWHRHSLLAQALDRTASPPRRIDNQFRTDADINVWMETTKAYADPDVDPEQGRWTWTVSDAVYNEWGKQGLKLAGEHMQQLLALCREHGITVAVVVYPAPLQIFANDRDSRQAKYWSEFCDQRAVDFINLFPEFINYKFPSPAAIYQTYFIESDNHWNEAGHQLVAGKIDEYLRKKLISDDTRSDKLD